MPVYGTEVLKPVWQFLLFCLDTICSDCHCFCFWWAFTLSCVQFKLICHLDKLGKIQLEWCVARFPCDWLEWLGVCCTIGGSALHFLLKQGQCLFCNSNVIINTSPAWHSEYSHYSDELSFHGAVTCLPAWFTKLMTCFGVHQVVSVSYLPKSKKMWLYQFKYLEKVLFCLSLIPPEDSDAILTAVQESLVLQNNSPHVVCFFSLCTIGPSNLHVLKAHIPKDSWVLFPFAWRSIKTIDCI